MAWIAFNPQGDGVGVDEAPRDVIRQFDGAADDWVELHDRGRALFVDRAAVYAVYPDDEEIDKEANLRLAAEAAEREGREAAL